MPKIAVIANKKSRSGASYALYESLVHARGWRVYGLGDASLDSQITDAVQAGCLTIAAAGGDGTISCVADALMRHDGGLRLGVIPAGTLNHFAKDLGVPLDLSEAIAVIEESHTRHVDVGLLNNRHFINNSSVGFYPGVIKARKPLEHRGWNAWLAFFWAIVALGVRRPSLRLEMGNANQLYTKRATSIFIGNNHYTFNSLATGGRAKLDEGLLFVAVVRSMSPARALALVYKIARGQLFFAPEVDAVGLSTCVIRSKKKLLSVSLDGELLEMPTPLTYSSIPKGLRVIVPRL